MSILTGPEIKRQIEQGQISISDFDPKRLGQNSYNLRLSNQLVTYAGDDGSPILDMKMNNRTHTIEFDSYMLLPGVLYLARTMERTKTLYPYVPMLEGRSSMGRLGLQVHVTAGFGDIGFDGCWTLEMTVVHPLRVYAGVEIAQLYFHHVIGADPGAYCGKYQGASNIQSSQLFRELAHDEVVEAKTDSRSASL